MRKLGEVFLEAVGSATTRLSNTFMVVAAKTDNLDLAKIAYSHSDCEGNTKALRAAAQEGNRVMDFLLTSQLTEPYVTAFGFVRNDDWRAIEAMAQENPLLKEWLDEHAAQLLAERSVKEKPPYVDHNYMRTYV